MLSTLEKGRGEDATAVVEVCCLRDKQVAFLTFTKPTNVPVTAVATSQGCMYTMDETLTWFIRVLKKSSKFMMVLRHNLGRL